MNESRRALLNSQYDPPEGIDPKSLRWAADYARALAEELTEERRVATELLALAHVLRAHARTREMADTCCAWCRKLPPLKARCPKRPKNAHGKWCVAAEHVRDAPGAYGRAENEATAEYRRAHPAAEGGS